MAYEINYDDDRFKQVEADRQNALNEVNNLYDGMAKESEGFYQAQIDASKEWGDKQQELQQEQTDFAIEQINQQKEQAKKDYIKEQSGAYQDWQKQSNKYGANAEQMAASGLANTGYSESSEVLMYNQYQSRVAIARESYGKAVLNYDNAINEAKLQNNSILAEIAYSTLQQQLQLSLEGFQYKNELLDKKVTQQNYINSRYDGKWQDVLNQMNTENSMAESVRQYNQDYALELKKYQDENGAITGGDEVGAYGNKFLNVNDLGIDPESISTYEKAVAYLRGKGVSTGGGLMTRQEWAKRKKTGSTKTGEAGEEMVFDTYEEYLHGFVNWKLQNPKG